MKITDIHILQIKVDLCNWMILKIETDADVIGWGDLSDSLHNEGVASIFQNIVKSFLIGKDPLKINECEKILTEWQYPILNNVRTFAVARSGLDQALWDITAKFYNIPLYKMYGADGIKEIPLYANLNNALKCRRTPKDLYGQGLLAKDLKFEIVKCTPFDEVNPSTVDCDFSKGFERLSALTELWPIDKIAIDCHQRFGRYELGTMVEKLLDKFGKPYWIEDPVPVLDYITIKKITVKHPEIRWVAGEDSFTIADIMRTVASDCYDIIMPDVKFIGGVSIVKGLIPTIEGMGKNITLHNPSGIISTAHSAHLSALTKGLPLEFPIGNLKNRELCSSPNENIKNGKYIFNNNPGIGLELSEDFLKKHAYEFINSNWTKY